jgi:hypothetical protein
MRRQVTCKNSITGAGLHPKYTFLGSQAASRQMDCVLLDHLVSSRDRISHKVRLHCLQMIGLDLTSGSKVIMKNYHIMTANCEVFTT